MGYDVRTEAVIGICFTVDLSRHNDINWGNGVNDESQHQVDEDDGCDMEADDDFDDDEMEDDDSDEDEIKVQKVVTLANSLGLDVEYDMDGESDTIDAIYIGIKLTHKRASEIVEATRLLEKVCTPDVIQQFVDIMGCEPIHYKPYNYGEPTIETREPMMYAAYDKSW